jgi:predicted aspartyl protease
MRLSHLAAALLLTACATPSLDDPPAATRPAASCKVERAAVLPVRFVQGNVLIPATINATPVQLVVDSGAMLSMLLPEAAARLGLPSDTHRQTKLLGTGGDVTTRNVTVRDLDIGGRSWLGESIATGSLPRIFQETPPVSGLLGSDYLGVFDVELDLPNRSMILWDVSNCSGDFIPWTQPHFVVPLHTFERRHMAATVEFEGHPVTALIDWGARTTMMTAETAERLGVTAETLAHDPVGTSRGVDQHATTVHLHEFADLRIGAEKFRKVRISVGPLTLHDSGMLLGIDYASTRRIWLSYNSRQMFVARKAAP